MRVGFALETEDLVAAAKKKLAAKGANLIVGNLAADGLGGDDNRAVFVDDRDLIRDTGLTPKTALADLILDWIAGRLS